MCTFPLEKVSFYISVSYCVSFLWKWMTLGLWILFRCVILQQGKGSVVTRRWPCPHPKSETLTVQINNARPDKAFI